jgi:predicted Zn-dependent protease
MNDRYLYFPMAGMAPFVVLGLSSISRGCAAKWQRLVASLALAALLALAICTQQRTKAWQNASSLWRDAVAKAPGSPVARYSLAEIEFRAGRYDEARQLLLGVIAEFPDRVAPYELLANIFYMAGDMNSAATYYLKALALKPDLANANLCLGNIYLSRNNAGLARRYFLEAAKARPDSPDIAYSLACAEALLGGREAALDYLQRAFRSGFRGCEAVRLNHELDSLRTISVFNKLVADYCEERSTR